MLRKKIQKKIQKTSEMEPVHFALRTLALTALLIIGALGADLYRLFH